MKTEITKFKERVKYRAAKEADPKVKAPLTGK